MRILDLVMKPQRRGAEVFAHALGRELERRGHVTAICYLYPAAGGGLELGPRDRVLGGREEHPLEELPGFHPRLLKRLVSSVRSFQPDIVQANGSRTVRYGSLLRRLRPRAPWALVYRNIGNPGDWLRGPVHRALYRHLVMRQMDGVVSVSRSTLDEVMRIYRLTVPAVHIPTAIDPRTLVPARSREDVRRSLGTALGAPVLFYAGSLTPEKRLDRVLRVAAALRGRWPELRLWIAGGGPERPELERRGAAQGLTGNLRFLGVRDDVADLLAAADLLLLTSDTEGIPAVVLEAGYLGLPVVATRVGGVAEAVVDGETGLLVQPGDDEGLTGAVAGLLADPARRRTLGSAARRRVEGRFLLDRAARRYEEFYTHLLEHR